MKKRTMITIPLLSLILCLETYYYVTYENINRHFVIGETIDEFNGVKIFYNGGVNNVSGRNVSSDGYNIGINYQCVEFIKRYYFERFSFKMPESRGHARDFYDQNIKDGELNIKRNLIQFKNGSEVKPEVEDIIVFAPTLLNPYGHIAIISNVFESSLQVVQQNSGPFGSSRESYHIENTGGHYYVQGKRVLGWLRMKKL